MPIHAIARLIQTMLYARRFFPYYVYNVLGGIEDDGEFTVKTDMIRHAVYKISPVLWYNFLSIEFPSIVLIHFSPGTGTVYSFDPVGSYEREACRAAGAAQSLVQPFLDNQVSSRLNSNIWTIEPDVYTNRCVSSVPDF